MSPPARLSVGRPSVLTDRAAVSNVRSALAHYHAGRLQRAVHDFEVRSPTALISSASASTARPFTPPAPLRSEQAALSLDPSDADLWCNKGSALALQGKLLPAMRCLRRAARLQPDAARHHHAMGLVWQYAGEAHAAAGCFERAIEIEPTHVRALARCHRGAAERARHARSLVRHEPPGRARLKSAGHARVPRRCFVAHRTSPAPRSCPRTTSWASPWPGAGASSRRCEP